MIEAVDHGVNDAEPHVDIEALLDPEGLGALVLEPTSVDEWLADAVILAKEAVIVWLEEPESDLVAAPVLDPDTLWLLVASPEVVLEAFRVGVIVTDPVSVTETRGEALIEPDPLGVLDILGDAVIEIEPVVVFDGLGETDTLGLVVGEPDALAIEAEAVVESDCMAEADCVVVIETEVDGDIVLAEAV